MEAIFADHIGAAIANARAFEEIRVAGKRLEQANQRLERELAERKGDGGETQGKRTAVPPDRGYGVRGHLGTR